MKQIALLTLAQLAGLFGADLSATPVVDHAALHQSQETEWDRFFGAVRSGETERRERRARVQADFKNIEAILLKVDEALS